MTGGDTITTEPQQIDFAHFTDNVTEVFNEVRNRNRPVLVERDGELYRIERAETQDIWKNYDPQKVQQALIASKGALAGVDLDELLRDLDAQREQGPGRFE